MRRIALAVLLVLAGGLRTAQSSKQQLEDQARQDKKQIVETGWKNQ